MMEMEDQSELCFPQLINISCRKPTSHWSEGVLFTVLLSIICIFTVVLNLMVIISISHFRQLHTPSNLLRLSLSVSDFLVGLLVIPVDIYLKISCWTLGDVFCFLWFSMSFLVTSASVGTMVLISADRYVAICDPLHYNTKVTVRRVQLCVCLCWFSSFLYCSIILKDQLVHPGRYISCYEECVFGGDYYAGVIDLVVTFLLPLSIIITLYMRVFVVAVSQARAMSSHVTSVTLQHSVTVRAKKSELKAARTLGVLVLVFLKIKLHTTTTQTPNRHRRSQSLFASYLKFVINFFYFNSCLNPLIYALFYPWFRRAVRHIVTLHILKPGFWGCNIL
ncbi:trace amine-associated receptor 13c-like [Dunckerocampus dactyliophorus]|uniref:trace amine-associated receptor 13c-like n=1 Tax=Dunckerocampus dactyliophorus TaxID=161453 RepID=UPI002405345F|nr:trace amine-associated receptor 13c-like [Dunckerocampus dactyliophorus]